MKKNIDYTLHDIQKQMLRIMIDESTKLGAYKFLNSSISGIEKIIKSGSYTKTDIEYLNQLIKSFKIRRTVYTKIK